MSKATDLIEQEHRRVEELFDRFERERTQTVAMELCHLLERHTEMEETFLYPELRRVDEELYADAMQEHEEADEVMQQIRRSAEPDRIAELVTELREMVSHHVEDEETEDLPRMEASCGEQRMEEVGERMERWKQQRSTQGDGQSDLLDLTKDELYEKAREADIHGRSSMNKEELAQELSDR